MFPIYHRNLGALDQQTFLIYDLALRFYISDAQLFWLHGQSNYKGVPFTGCSGVNRTIERSYNNDISFGDNFCSGFHISQNNNAGI